MSRGAYHFGGFVLDLSTRQLRAAEDVRHLTPRAFDLLHTLVRNVDQIVPKGVLLSEVWAGVHVEEGALKVRIAEVRAALEEDATAPAHLHTHPRVGYRFAGPVAFLGAAGEGAPLPVLPFSDRPAVAVLRFDNFSADPGDDYLVDGIVEELITCLARSRHFPVIARNSSFAYRGPSIDVPTVCRELGARYLLEGSIQRSRDRVRVTVQLIDGETDHHVFAERFESTLTEITALRDEIAELIAGAIHSQVYVAEVRDVVRRSADNVGAWHRLLQAWSLQASLDPDQNAAAMEQFRLALEEDPGCALAYSGLAMSHFREVVHGWSKDPLDSFRETQHNAARSMQCDPQDPYSHLATAVAFWLVGRRDDLLAAIEHAVWLNPSLSWAYLWGGIAYGVSGVPDRSLEMANRAIRLSPLDPLRGVFDYALAVAHFSAAQYDGAYDVAARAARAMPGWGWIHAIAASSAGWLGRAEEAQASREEANRLLPGIGRRDLARVIPFAATDFLERSIEGARRAGWPD